MDVSILRIGETGLQLLKYATNEARISGALRTDEILRGLGGIIAGAFTTTERDAIPTNEAPYGIIILNTTTNRYEWNKGSDAARDWQSLSLSIHAAQHAPSASDPIDYTLVHLLGTLAARPAASSANAGLLYYATDDENGTLYRSNGSIWEKISSQPINLGIRFPIDLKNPQQGANPGNCFPAVSTLTAWEEWHWQFLKDVKGKLYGTIDVPKNLATTPNAKIVLDLAANASSGVTRMQVSVKAIADGESKNPSSLTSELAQDITVPGTVRLRKLVTFPASGSLSETIVGADLLIVEIYHEGDHTNDTLTVNTELNGAYLEVDVK